MKKRTNQTISKKTADVKPAQPEPVGEAELHALLSVKLADGPMTFGDLRTQFDISPLRLEFECLERFPECYQRSANAKGRPMIGLKPDRPPLDVMLDRAPLIAWVAESGPSGIYVASLHKHTGLTSVRIEELLDGMQGIERVVRNGRVLFKVIPDAILCAAPRKTPSDPAVLRDQLVGLCGDSKRHLSWLELTMDRQEILTVLTEFPNDFGTESLTGDDKLIWVSSAELSRRHKGSLADETMLHNCAQPEAQGPLLEEVFSPEVLRELKHRPHSPGMLARRVRQPSVKL